MSSSDHEVNQLDARRDEEMRRVIEWLRMKFRDRDEGGDDVIQDGTAPSKSSKIEQVERRTEDAMRRLRAIGVHVDVYELRRREEEQRRRSR